LHKQRIPEFDFFDRITELDKAGCYVFLQNPPETGCLSEIVIIDKGRYQQWLVGVSGHEPGNGSFFKFLGDIIRQGYQILIGTKQTFKFRAVEF
jgi:hypothetical protein